MHRNITSPSTYARASGGQKLDMVRVMDKSLEHGENSEYPRDRPRVNLNEAPPKKRQKPEVQESLVTDPSFDLKPALEDEPSPQPPAGA